MKNVLTQLSKKQISAVFFLFSNAALLCALVLVGAIAPASAQTNRNERYLPPIATEVPLTWQDDYFPEFRLRISHTDLTSLLTKDEVKGSETKYPMTLNYQGRDFAGTIRRRVPGSSSAGDKKQFRLDFAKKVTFPDGYVADRFETDHGNGYTLHEWLAWRMLNQAAERRPDLKILRKKANVVAIYFNDQLYHVQTLLEDVNKDLLEPQLGTRKLATFKYGCEALTGASSLDHFCGTFSPAKLQSMMDIPSFLYATAAIQVLGSFDNYPRLPNNYYFVQETETERVWFMADDLDMTFCPYDPPYSDPFQIDYGYWQRHFTDLLQDKVCLEAYYNNVKDLCSLWQPEPLRVAVDRKYAQVRDTLQACDGLPYGIEYYDYLYQESLPLRAEQRFQFLTTLMEETNVAAIAEKVARR